MIMRQWVCEFSRSSVLSGTTAAMCGPLSIDPSPSLDELLTRGASDTAEFKSCARWDWKREKRTDIPASEVVAAKVATPSSSFFTVFVCGLTLAAPVPGSARTRPARPGRMAHAHPILGFALPYLC